MISRSRPSHLLFKRKVIFAISIFLAFIPDNSLPVFKLGFARFTNETSLNRFASRTTIVNSNQLLSRINEDG